MQIAKFHTSVEGHRIGLVQGDQVLPFRVDEQFGSLTDVFETGQARQAIESLVDTSAPLQLSEVTLLAPLDRQEVWAAGVTYKRSKSARMEESEAAADCYDRVYVADRPELFLKATPNRVSGPVRMNPQEQLQRQRGQINTGQPVHGAPPRATTPDRGACP